MKKIFIVAIGLLVYPLMYAQSIDTLIDVGGYKLHLFIIKGKSAPILFESGNGADAAVWKDLLKQLHDATNATLITYDRAGIGQSGIDTNKIGLSNEVQTLEYALKKLGYSQKIFLVSHSFGSFYSILFAQRNKQKISGSVFIEPALACNYTKQRNKEGNKTITADLWDKIKRDAIGLYYVLKNYEEICDLMANKKYPIKIPTTVIAAQNQPFLKTPRYKDEWRNCLQWFGSLPNHAYIFAKNCGHTVWKDNPKLVIREIVTLYKRTNK